MNVETRKDCVAIETQDPKEFATEYRAAMERLRGCKTEVVTDLSECFRAVIFFEEETRTTQTVADEFHEEGLRFLCMHCPHHEDPETKRHKRVRCKYNEFGTTHLEHEACELFYKQVKNGVIEPKEEPISTEKIAVRHGTGVRWV